MKIITFLLLTLFAFAKPAEVKQAKENKFKQELLNSLSAFSDDVVGIVYAYCNNWEQVKEFKSKANYIICMAQLKNGNIVYVTNRAGNSDIIICTKYNKPIKKISHEFKTPLFGGDPAIGIIALENGNFVTCYNSLLKIWSPDGKQIKAIPVLGKVYSIANLNNGNFIIYQAGKIQERTISGQYVNSLEINDGNKWGKDGIIQLNNGSFVAASDNSIIMLDSNFEQKEAIQTNSNITSLIKLKNGDFATSHNDGSINIWKPDGKFVQEIITDNPVNSLSLLLDGTFASIHHEEIIKIWRNQALCD